MGKISQGVLGGFSGKVGNVIGASWKGIDYMRIMPANVANPRTQGQVDQRSKFVTVLRFLQPMTDFLKVGFKLYAKKMTQFNSAMSYNLLNAVTGEYPNYSVDYEKALVSRGNLSGALNPSVDSTVPGSVDISWDDNSGIGSAQETDKALLVIFNPEKGEAIFDIDGVARSASTQNLVVPTNYSGDTVQAFIGFISADGKSVSNSVYAGSLQIA